MSTKKALMKAEAKPLSTKKKETYSLTGDLLAWADFHLNCNKLQDSLPVYDDMYLKFGLNFTDPSFTNLVMRSEAMGIERPTFKNIAPQVDHIVEKTIENKRLLKYDEYRKSYEEENKGNLDALDNKMFENTVNMQKEMKIIVPCGIAGLLVAGLGAILAFGVGANNTATSIIGFFIMIIGSTSLMVAEVLFFKWYFQYSANKTTIPSEIEAEKKRLEDGFSQYADDKFQEEIKTKKPLMIPKFQEKLNEKLKDYYKAYDLLKEQYHELSAKSQIPVMYRDDASISTLLGYLVSKRADTLKEALNLYEQEKYNRQMAAKLDSQIDTYKNQIQALNAEVASIKMQNEIVNTALIAQNKAISSKLNSINAATSYLALDSFFDGLL
jgi:hypothetical protein